MTGLKKIIIVLILIIMAVFIISFFSYFDNRRLANAREETRCAEKYFDYRNGFIKRDRIEQSCLDNCLLVWKVYETGRSGSVKCKWDFDWTYLKHFSYWFYRLKNLGNVKETIYEIL